MTALTLERDITRPDIITDEMEHATHDLGIKLEFIGGLPVWEASPAAYHQQKSLDMCISIIQNGKSSGCGCFPLTDVTIKFPDGSVKVPDVAVFCEQPRRQKSACTQIPEAVIEILSDGYEMKDTHVSLPFYIKQRIADIVLYNPETEKVSHYHNGTVDEYDSPVDLTFACGCQVTV